ncbi:hypothetical protein F5Y09DRAFT_186778 [Xylaria sp. FL1042]|nr:hypothetical protein F5Y09DRAFT_186778 [Xylaria sp. FL1042]
MAMGKRRIIVLAIVHSFSFRYLVGFTLSRIGSLLGSRAATGGRTAAVHDSHIAGVAAVVLDDLTSAHFEVWEVARLVGGFDSRCSEGSR